MMIKIETKMLMLLHLTYLGIIYLKIVKISFQKLSLKMVISLLMKWDTILHSVNNHSKVLRREFWINKNQRKLN